MGLIDFKPIHDEITDPFLTRVNTETIPQLSQLVKDGIGEATGQLGAVVTTEIANLSGVIEKAIGEVRDAVQSFDGAVLEINIPTITIKLKLPPKGAL